MRTTVSLPSAAHRRVQALAAARGTSISAVVADLTLRGLAQIEEEPVELERNPRTGLPAFRVGHEVTSEQVADLVDEE